MKRTGTNEGPCPDCGAEVGQEHTDGCDVARCLVTGGQRLMHDDAGHDCGRDVWTGVWPGVEDAERFGWYARFVYGEGWITCSEDHPEATADLNRLYGNETVWDREAHRWELAEP